MSEEYLWNREGDPDPEVVRLESLLGQLQYRGSFSVEPRRKHAWWLAVAAAVLVAGVVAVPLMTRGALTAWQLADGHRLRAGQMIETDASARVTIESASTGRVDIEARSRLKLSNSAESEERFHPLTLAAVIHCRSPRMAPDC